MNATHNSHNIISKWVDGRLVTSNVLEKVHPIGLKADESTGISVAKELILDACVLCRRKLHVCFLKLIKIPDGTAETIEKPILTYLEQANNTI